jgi:DNA-binding GntR family transcriptional regulator
MIDEHHTVVGAVARKKASDEEKALRKHLQMVLSFLPDIQRSHPQYFES